MHGIEAAQDKLQWKTFVDMMNILVPQLTTEGMLRK
jgi:hypothetical protein